MSIFQKNYRHRNDEEDLIDEIVYLLLNDSHRIRRDRNESINFLNLDEFELGIDIDTEKIYSN